MSQKDENQSKTKSKSQQKLLKFKSAQDAINQILERVESLQTSLGKGQMMEQKPEVNGQRVEIESNDKKLNNYINQQPINQRLDQKLDQRLDQKLDQKLDKMLEHRMQTIRKQFHEKFLQKQKNYAATIKQLLRLKKEADNKIEQLNQKLLGSQSLSQGDQFSSKSQIKQEKVAQLKVSQADKSAFAKILKFKSQMQLQQKNNTSSELKLSFSQLYDKVYIYQNDKLIQFSLFDLKDIFKQNQKKKDSAPYYQLTTKNSSIIFFFTSQNPPKQYQIKNRQQIIQQCKKANKIKFKQQFINYQRQHS